MLLLLVAWRLAWALVFDLGGESFNGNSVLEVYVVSMCLVMVVWVGRCLWDLCREPWPPAGPTPLAHSEINYAGVGRATPAWAGPLPSSG